MRGIVGGNDNAYDRILCALVSTDGHHAEFLFKPRYTISPRAREHRTAHSHRRVPYTWSTTFPEPLPKCIGDTLRKRYGQSIPSGPAIPADEWRTRPSPHDHFWEPVIRSAHDSLSRECRPRLSRRPAVPTQTNPGSSPACCRCWSC